MALFCSERWREAPRLSEEWRKASDHDRTLDMLAFWLGLPSGLPPED